MGVLAFLLSFIAILVAVSGGGRAKELQRRVAALERLAAARERNVEAAPAPPPEVTPAPPEPEIQPIEGPWRASEAPAADAAPAPPPEPVRAPATITLAAFEDRLMRHWLVWLGALALALGAVFLVKYSIERGFFGPTARVVAGIVLGLALLAAGEWARRHPPALGPSPDSIAAGLSAAGVVALFASVYGGYALYDLVPPLAAFVALAAVSAAAALLSLLYGWGMAILGFAGAYVVPALIATPHPSAAGLLVYVALVNGGALYLQHWIGRPALGWIVAAGALTWAALALTLADGTVPVAVYLLITPAMFVLFVASDRAAPEILAFVWLTAGIAALLMIMTTIVAGYSGATVILAALLAASLMALGLRDPFYDRLAWIGGALAVLLLAAWEFDRALPDAPFGSYVLLAPPVFVQGFAAFAIAAAIVAGAGGVLASERAPHPARWACLAAATPVLILVVSYWRVALLDRSLPWAALALILAGANLAAAERASRKLANPSRALALAAFSIAIVASVSLGLAMALRLAWLSIGLSLQLPALVWLADRTGVRTVRWVAFAVAAIVLVRLVLNPSVADYAIGSGIVFNTLLYTYGVPCLAFWWAARGFGHSGDDAVVRLLESGTIALFTALVSLDIRHAVEGSLASGEYGFLEQALQSDAWLAIAYGIAYRRRTPEAPVQKVAWRVLLAVATFNLVVGPLASTNPLVTGDSVGTTLIADPMLLAYLVPAAFAVLFMRVFRALGGKTVELAASIAALALGFVYLSLETRHAFQGDVIAWGETSDGEWYAYSAVWLVYGAGLMLLGLWLDRQKLRLAGIAIGAIVACKVFLFDMATLTGLYRAASFLGLGASLMGLGYLYQHLARRPAAGAD